MKTGLLVFLVAGMAAGQADAPRFDRYRVTEAPFSGKPVQPMIKTAAERRFRTMIRTGAAMGPDFAGHFTVVEWGCGAGCVSIVVVDASTGAIHRGPFRTLAWMPRKYEGKYASNDDSFEQLVYKLDSRLLVARGRLDEANTCASYFWEWTGSEFRLIRTIPSVALPE